MIPRFLPNGHLPPGRHPAEIEEIYDRFVAHVDFRRSTSRPQVWVGFLDYLETWRQAQDALGIEVLRGLWIAGSFISAELEPLDIDVSPHYDELLLRGASGRPGVGNLKKLFSQRASVAAAFKVEPFEVPWRAIPSTLFPARLDDSERDLLAIRGGVDSWWGRVRPPGPRSAPLAPTSLADRGYLEVMW